MDEALAAMFAKILEEFKMEKKVWKENEKCTVVLTTAKILSICQKNVQVHVNDVKL